MSRDNSNNNLPFKKKSTKGKRAKSGIVIDNASKAPIKYVI
jgi:hypothetical protein